MKRKAIIPLLLWILFSFCSPTRSNKNSNIVEQRPPVKCTENSPERRGEEGCTVLANRRVIGALGNSFHWHIDRFTSLEAAMKTAGPNDVAAAAHGSFWLMSLEPKSEDHHGGVHVAWIGAIPLPAADSFAMRVQSSLLLPGATTPAHTHPGPEILYVVDGEQCTETPKTGVYLRAGESYIVPDGVIHRGRVVGSKPRRILALNLYNAAHVTSHDLGNPPTLASCK